MKKVHTSLKHSAAVMAAALVGASSAQALDTAGYLRIGPGMKAPSGPKQGCFNGALDNAIGRGGVGRLGNECDTYGEFTLGQNFNVNGVEVRAVTMANVFNTGSDLADAKIGLPQAYVEMKGLDFAPGLTFWGGKRYGNRAIVYFDDYFPINLTGTGAGVDGIKLGSADMGVAVFRDDMDKNGQNSASPATRANFDIYGINLNPGGKLRVTGVATSYGGPNGASGAGLSLQHEQTGVLGGVNMLYLQAARGSAETTMNTAAPGATSDRRSWRIADAMTWGKGPLTGQAMVRLGQYGTDTDRISFHSLGGRVAYAVTQNFKLQAEAGTSFEKPLTGEVRRLNKVTFAPTLTVGPNFLDRPELRFYVSHFQWNDAYGAAYAPASGRSRTTAGLQLEVWY